MDEVDQLLSRIKRQNSDQLSSLPDSLICHILSFIPTKQAVATSVLAKRWRSLWTYVPSLDFESNNYGKKSGEDPSFTETVTGVLLLHNTRHLNRFCISSEEPINQQQFNCWMRTLVTRSIEEIEFYLVFGYVNVKVVVPYCLLTCKTLVVLKLNARVTIPANCAVCLPCVKKLRLDCVKYENDKSLVRLLSGCPVLEDLAIFRFGGDNLFHCDITSSTLKSLTVIIEIYVDSPNDRYMLSLNTPALRFLDVSDSSCHLISAGTLPHLIEADICLSSKGKKWKGDIDEYCTTVFLFVQRLYNVQFLKFDSDRMKYHQSINFIPDAKFDNLTKLDLQADWCFLSHFLDIADNLEILVIRKVDDELKCWKDPHHVPKCMSSCLRTVSVHAVGESATELNMLWYILQNAKVLRRMEIHAAYPSSNYKAKLNFLQQISLIPRGSETCEVAFY